MNLVKNLEKEYVLNCIVERKTISDLAHSITDKRYTDQKYRLKNCGLSRLFYLIEGATSTTSNL
jgi:crossover junction endonuclease MUS81